MTEVSKSMCINKYSESRNIKTIEQRLIFMLCQTGALSWGQQVYRRIWGTDFSCIMISIKLTSKIIARYMSNQSNYVISFLKEMKNRKQSNFYCKFSDAIETTKCIYNSRQKHLATEDTMLTTVIDV